VHAVGTGRYVHSPQARTTPSQVEALFEQVKIKIQFKAVVTEHKHHSKFTFTATILLECIVTFLLEYNT